MKAFAPNRLALAIGVALGVVDDGQNIGLFYYDLQAAGSQWWPGLQGAHWNA